ncbi:hypothetical protein [Cupriavidus basilensis]|jgi:hypothetical protein|uniref:hypothetical protein n=1 Tax=Cupriavidus basilensis TaxID=68895 RepID=UPI0023E8010C|nr:hypothetical protein [Cupriavidus basilensis]MDF3881088.1 hypothetical protein [Cupriavidus basilensis]
MKRRKLYQVRVHLAGSVFGKQVGHKCRLLPRGAARRVANRLRECGLLVTIDPLVVNLTQVEAAYLDRRY